jgi:hypothetical protein
MITKKLKIMKELKIIIRTLMLIVISGAFLTSCNNDDDTNAPMVTYSITNLDATFFTPGNSAAPQIDWGGNQGTFSLAAPVTGLSVDATTGILNWTKDLPIDTHNVEVLASNSAGETPTNLTLNNPLQGLFIGNYDETGYFEIEFNSDNTAVVTEVDNMDNTIVGTGIWTKTGATISIDYDNLGELWSLLGTLTTETNAVYSGEWYYGHGAISGNEGGTFEVILE